MPEAYIARIGFIFFNSDWNIIPVKNTCSMKGIAKRMPAYSAVELIEIKLFESGRLLNKS